MHKFNLLTEDLIRYKRDDGKVIKASLPQVFVALMKDKIASFPALRPHQRHAWHAFMVQLGAMATHKAGLEEPPTDADEWRRIIRGLTKDEYRKVGRENCDSDNPWRLVVDDITESAFMQPPISPSASKPKYTKEPSLTPDELDTLDTGKNHALKKSIIPASELDSWIFALITEQTTDAFFANNPGISRISGNGSRLAFSLTTSTRLGPHIKRDVIALLSQWHLVGENSDMTTDGHALLWIVPWHGTEGEEWPLSKFHPLYIEVCRRRRMCIGPDGSLYVQRVSGTKRRIEVKKSKLNGRTCDPWIPIDLKGDRAMRLPQSVGFKSVGFTYEQIANCLNTGDWELPLLCKPTRCEIASSEPMYLVARGIAPGEVQNRTGGYHERIIPISHKVATAMLLRESAEDLGRVAKKRVDAVDKVQRVLKDAIATFIVKGDNIYDRDKVKQLNVLRNRKEIQPWLKRLDEVVEVRFFEALLAEFEKEQKAERDAIHDKWLLNGRRIKGEIHENGDGVINQAKRILLEAGNTLKCREVERYRAIANADSLFERKMKHDNRMGFPYLFRRKEEDGG